jgi:hypothetical protein
MCSSVISVVVPQIRQVPFRGPLGMRASLGPCSAAVRGSFSTASVTKEAVVAGPTTSRTSGLECGSVPSTVNTQIREYDCRSGCAWAASSTWSREEALPGRRRTTDIVALAGSQALTTCLPGVTKPVSRHEGRRCRARAVHHCTRARDLSRHAGRWATGAVGRARGPRPPLPSLHILGVGQPNGAGRPMANRRVRSATCACLTTMASASGGTGRGSPRPSAEGPGRVLRRSPPGGLPGCRGHPGAAR